MTEEQLAQGKSPQSPRGSNIYATLGLSCGIAFFVLAACVRIEAEFRHFISYARLVPDGVIVVILCAVLVLPVLTLVFGYAARARTKAVASRRRAVVTLWLGWLSLPWLCLLAKAPLITDGFEGKQTGECRSALKSIGLAIEAYARDAGGPMPTSLQELVDKGYIRDVNLFRYPRFWPWEKPAPVDPHDVDGDGDYYYARIVARPVQAGRTPIAWEKAYAHGRTYVNVLFADYHVAVGLDMKEGIKVDAALYEKPPVMLVER